jgi:hypothetical protein
MIQCDAGGWERTWSDSSREKSWSRRLSLWGSGVRRDLTGILRHMQRLFESDPGYNMKLLNRLNRCDYGLDIWNVGRDRK